MPGEISSPTLSSAAWVGSALSLVATNGLKSVAGCFSCAYNIENKPMRSALGGSMWGPVLDLSDRPEDFVGSLIETADSYPKVNVDDIVRTLVSLDANDDDSETDYSVDCDLGVIGRVIEKPRACVSKAAYDSATDKGLTVAVINHPTYIPMQSMQPDSVGKKIKQDLEAGDVAREAATAKIVTLQPQNYLTKPLLPRSD